MGINIRLQELSERCTYFVFHGPWICFPSLLQWSPTLSPLLSLEVGWVVGCQRAEMREALSAWRWTIIITFGSLHFLTLSTLIVSLLSYEKYIRLKWAHVGCLRFVRRKKLGNHCTAVRFSEPNVGSTQDRRRC